MKLEKIPNHIGFIIDGNGRWAKSKGLARSLGHKKGIENVETIVKECFYTYNIKHVSIYAFSTNNWNRPQKEVDYLAKLFKKYLSTDFNKKYKGAKLVVMGDYAKFGPEIEALAKKAMENTKNNTDFTLNIGINYSGTSEIVYAVNNIIAEGIKSVDTKTIEDHLYTKGQPPLDFLIRTSGEYRISDFMIWQGAYAEYYFPAVHWPAFSKQDLFDALMVYQSRDRRFGAIKE